LTADGRNLYVLACLLYWKQLLGIVICCFRISCRRNRKQQQLLLPMERCLVVLLLDTETGELLRYPTPIGSGEWVNMCKVNKLLSSLNLDFLLTVAFHMH
jgi:hypothetical protein